jgi:hypothetical protein
MPTDDFSGSGALGGDWTVTAGSFTQSGGNCYGDTGSTSSFAIYTTGSVSDDHESETTLQPRGSGQYFGPVVRGNTTDSACANVDAGADGLYVSTWSAGGAQTVIIGPVTCPAAGTRIKLRAVGTQLRLYYDDVEQTGEGSPWTPAGLPATGRYGISAYSNGTSTGASAWTGANVASTFSLTPTAALALTGTLSVSGEITAQEPNPFSLTPTAPLALTGALSVSGDTSYAQPWEMGAPLVLGLSATLGVSGDLSFRIPFALEPTAPLALSGVLDVSGAVVSSSAEQPQAFYRLVRRSKPKRYLTPQRDLERFAERAFTKPDPPELVPPRIEIELPRHEEPPRLDNLDREIAELAAALEAKSKQVQRKIVKAAYDDDEEILALL